MITIKNVTIYKDKQCQMPILHNLNFEVPRNHTFGIAGPSGCGKSTLLRTLCSLHTHWTGEIFIEGNAIPRKSRPKDVQMVFQDPYASLHPRHTVYEILGEPLLIRRIPHNEDTLLKALEDVFLSSEHLFRYPHQLSGGQRQRVSIARSLLLEPKVLLLDECTSALDVSVQKDILTLLKKLQNKKDMTCLLVSHALPVIHFMSNEYLDLNKYTHHE